MLQAKTILLTVPFSDSLAELDRVVTPHQNSILNTLVALSEPSSLVYQTGTDQDGYAASYAGCVAVVTGADGGEITVHTTQMDSIIGDLKNLVSAHLSHARNVVNPLVTAFRDAYNAYQEVAKPRLASEDFNIITLRVPELLQDESFLGEIAYGREIAKVRPKTYLKLGMRSQEQIQALMVIGQSRLDEVVQTWLGAKEEGWLESVWNVFFGDVTALGEAFKISGSGYDSLDRMTPYEAADIALAVYLISRRIYKEVPEDARMSLDQYQETVAMLREYTAWYLVSSVQKIAQNNDAGILVVETNAAQKFIKVNGDLYGPWLDAGGTPETLLGMLVTNQRLTTIATINMEADKLKREWEAYDMMFTAGEINKRSDYTRAALKNIFAEQITQATPDEKEVRESHTDFVTVRVNQANTFIDGLSTGQLNDSNAMALVLVAKIRFDYTSAFYILSDIEEACKINPGIDVREAGLLATANYLGDFFADQIALASV